MYNVLQVLTVARAGLALLSLIALVIASFSRTF